MAYTKTLTYGKGYTGKAGNKCWIAKITGTDKQYGLSRSFIEPDSVEREHFNRPRTMITFTYELEHGLYECSSHGDRWFWIVCEGQGDGAVAAFKPSDERVKAMAELMDHGMDFNAARRATKPEAKAVALGYFDECLNVKAH